MAWRSAKYAGLFYRCMLMLQPLITTLKTKIVSVDQVS